MHAVMTDPAYDELRKEVGLDEESVVLMFSTEGATDPENYRRIIEAKGKSKNKACFQTETGSALSE